MARTASTKAPSKKKITTKEVAARGPSRRSSGTGFTVGSAKGKHLVIVESPAKAKTINKYLGEDYIVLASVGHVRDLPSKAPKVAKGQKKAPVPGVDLEHRFTPTYQVLEGKEKVVSELKAASKEADEVWFATDLDREGEAIAWHLAQELKIDPTIAKRVIFPAITKTEIEKAFSNPHAIDIDRVNAQQARRIVDRIVGYQVSPLLWKKIARGLSAGRVQSVAVRLVVEREREIRAFVPDEYWQINANFALSETDAKKLIPQWQDFLKPKSTKELTPTVKLQNEWLAKHNTVKAELVEIAGEKFDVRTLAKDLKPNKEPPDLTTQIADIATLAGLTKIKSSVSEDKDGKGPARFLRTVTGDVDPSAHYAVSSIQTKQTVSRPSAPFITSSMQQAASTRLGFGAQRTMGAAQSLYEGVEIPGEGPVGLITYMRTDSTHIAGEAIEMARTYIKRSFGDAYLPEKPNFYSSANKAAQEAHEAIRPTSLDYPPEKIARALKPDQLKLYTLIWERFVACQMNPAIWNSTSVFITGGTDPKQQITFKASGRTLVFDGFYRVTGVPTASDEQTLPELKESGPLHPFAIMPTQKFTSPPPRYSEASLIKMLESEGIGRPSTYASIISVIQNRKYAEQIERRFHATDLGEVVTDKLIEAFPRIMDVGYTREMEAQLDKIEEDHLDWIDMLHTFYNPFKVALASAEENLTHAKAETTPAPYKCDKCGSPTVYRFGRNGRFLSCSTYPECNYAAPIDRNGKPRTAEYVDVRCPKTGRPMVRRTGRFGPFITTALLEGESNDIGMILNIDKKGHITAPSMPPLETTLPCPTCESPLNLRDGARGPWLGCSRFPKCRGRGKWAVLEEVVRAALEKQLDRHKAKHPIPIITTLEGKALTDATGKPVKDAPTADQLVLQDEPAWQHEETAA